MQLVWTSLWPVLAWIAVGLVLRRTGMVSAVAVDRITRAVFWAVIPAYLLLTMSRADLAHLHVRPVAAYFLGAFVMIGGALAWQGLTRRAAVWGLAATFSNNVMIGLPLVKLSFGEAGVATMMSLLVVHSLVLLTVATSVLELASAREAMQRPADVASARQRAGQRWAKALGSAALKTVFHPVPLPIIAGLIWAASGWGWPDWLHAPHGVLKTAFAPLVLTMVGLSLGPGALKGLWRSASALAIAKNMVFPAVVALACWAVGAQGVAAATMVLAAALPMGANVMLFAQRYEAEPELVSAAISLSSIAALFSVSVVLLLIA